MPGCVCVCVVFQRATPHAGQHPSMCLYYYEKANSWESGHSKVYSNVHPEIIYMEVSRLYTAVCICISFHLNFSLSFSRIAVFSSCTVSKNKNRVRVVAWFFRSTCPYLSDFHVGPVFFCCFCFAFSPFFIAFLYKCVSAWEANLILFWLPSQTEKYPRSTKSKVLWRLLARSCRLCGFVIHPGM